MATTRALRPSAPLAFVVAGFGGALMVGGTWLLHLNAQPLSASSLGFALPFASFLVVGTIIAWKRPDHRIGWLLLVASVSILAYGAGEEYGRYGLVTRPTSLPAAWYVTWFRTSLWVPCAVVAIVYLPLLFPTGEPLSARWRHVGTIAAAVAVVLAVGGWIGAWTYSGTALLDPDQAWAEAAPVTRVVQPLFMVVLACGVAAIASLIVRFRRADGVERQQIKWVLFSSAVFVIGLMASMFVPVGQEGSWPFAGAVLIAVSVGVAVLRYRLFEIDRIISRTLAYAVVLAMLVGVYAVSVLALGAAARTIAGETGDLVVALSTLLVAAVFQPVRRRVQGSVDRRFNRSRYDAQRTVESFGRELRDELEIAALARQLRVAVAGSVAPSSVTLWTPRSRS